MPRFCLSRFFIEFFFAQGIVQFWPNYRLLWLMIIHFRSRPFTFTISDRPLWICLYNLQKSFFEWWIKLVSEKVKKMARVLRDKDSSYYQSLVNMFLDVREHLEESRDISMHLKPLRSLLDDIEQTDMAEIEPKFKCLYHLCALIWRSSDHYRTPARVSTKKSKIFFSEQNIHLDCCSTSRNCQFRYWNYENFPWSWKYFQIRVGRCKWTNQNCCSSFERFQIFIFWIPSKTSNLFHWRATICSMGLQATARILQIWPIPKQGQYDCWILRW